MSQERVLIGSTRKESRNLAVVSKDKNPRIWEVTREQVARPIDNVFDTVVTEVYLGDGLSPRFYGMPLEPVDKNNAMSKGDKRLILTGHYRCDLLKQGIGTPRS
jgi:hypothetical protein